MGLRPPRHGGQPPYRRVTVIHLAGTPHHGEPAASEWPTRALHSADILFRGAMRARFPARAFLALISTAPVACGPSQASVDAADPMDAAADAANAGDAVIVMDALDASSAGDVAPGMDGPAGFFVVGDIDGQRWLA